MFCRNCGNRLEDNQAVCPACGTAVSPQPGPEPQYRHAPFQPDFQQGYSQQQYQPYGQPQGQPYTQQDSPYGQPQGQYLAGKDKTIIIIICIFFGYLGIHNFIMGESKKGLIKIVLTFCCGIGFIFALIDLIKICTDSYVVDPEKFI